MVVGARVASPLAVISGGSSGIGLELARLLRAKGYALVLLARDIEKLSNARDGLMESPGPSVDIFALDVSDEGACSATIRRLLALKPGIDWLITCAGIVEPGLFLEQSSEVHHRQMAVNYFGTLNLVRPVAAHMAARGAGGRITFVASAVCFGGIAGMAGYTASKDALFGLAETLHVELAEAGILVSVACPADTETPQLENERMARPEITRRIADGGGVMSARAVAQAIISGVEAKRFLVVPGALMAVYAVFYSLIRPFLLRRQKRLASLTGKGKV